MLYKKLRHGFVLETLFFGLLVYYHFHQNIFFYFSIFFYLLLISYPIWIASTPLDVLFFGAGHLEAKLHPNPNTSP